MSINIMLTAILKAMLAALICIAEKESSFGKLYRKKVGGQRKQAART